MADIKVFISSVQREFERERRLLCDYIRTDALLGQFFVPFIFEDLPASEISAQKAYLTQAAACHIYLGIFGTQYGYEDAEGISPTEREYDTATEHFAHRLIYTLRTEAPRHPKEQAFISKVEQNVVRRAFTTYEELRTADRRRTPHQLSPVALCQGPAKVLPHLRSPLRTVLWYQGRKTHPLFLTGYIEHLGTGTTDMIDDCAEYGLRSPEFIQAEDLTSSSSVATRENSSKLGFPLAAPSVPHHHLAQGKSVRPFLRSVKPRRKSVKPLPKSVRPR